MNEFEPEKFVEWLEEKEGPIHHEEVNQKFSYFPWNNIPVGITSPYMEDKEKKLGWYYKRDLRKAALSLQNYD